MKSFEFERWDHDRLVVNRDAASILRSSGLTTFRALMDYTGGTSAKNVLRERTTTRIVLADETEQEQPFYIKRHWPSPWKEYVKPWLRLTRPILGARNEWEAILKFQAASIPTMIPVALGECRRQSFIVTASIEGCEKLSHWMDDHLTDGLRPDDLQMASLLHDVAHIARRMHDAGLHHQDFYLTHLLLPDGPDRPTPDRPTGDEEGRTGIHVIDLGRARYRKRLSRRWIVKDLAQLNYSARLLSHSDRRRFLELYLGRPLTVADRPLVWRIVRKSAAIARHSRRNRL